MRDGPKARIWYRFPSWLASSATEVESRDPNKYGALFASFLLWPITVAYINRHPRLPPPHPPPPACRTRFVTWLDSNMASLEDVQIWAPGSGECKAPRKGRSALHDPSRKRPCAPIPTALQFWHRFLSWSSVLCLKRGFKLGRFLLNFSSLRRRPPGDLEPDWA